MLPHVLHLRDLESGFSCSSIARLWDDPGEGEEVDKCTNETAKLHIDNIFIRFQQGALLVLRA